MLLILLLHAATLGALLTVCGVRKSKDVARKKVTSRLVVSEESSPAPANSRAVSRERVRPIVAATVSPSSSSSARPPTTNKISASSLNESEPMCALDSSQEANEAKSALSETTNDAETTEDFECEEMDSSESVRDTVTDEEESDEEEGSEDIRYETIKDLLVRILTEREDDEDDEFDDEDDESDEEFDEKRKYRIAAKKALTNIPYTKKINPLLALCSRESGESIELKATALSHLSHLLTYWTCWFPTGFDDKFKAVADDFIEEYNIEMVGWVKRCIGHFIEEIAVNHGYEGLIGLTKEACESDDVSLKLKTLGLITHCDGGKRAWGEAAENLIVNSIQGSNRSLRNIALEALYSTTLHDDSWNAILPTIITIAEGKCDGPRVSHKWWINGCANAHIVAMEHLCKLAGTDERWDLLRPHVARLLAIATKEIIHKLDCVNGGSAWNYNIQLLQHLLERFHGLIPDNLINDIFVACLLNTAGSATYLFDQWLYTPFDFDFGDGLWGRLLNAITKNLGDGRCGEQMMSLTQEFFNSDEWSRRVAALLTWTEVIDKKWGQERVNILIDHALLGFTDPHPKVRATAVHLIGRVSLIIHGYEDLPHKIVSALVSLAADPVFPVRVQAVKALNCLLIMDILTPELMARYYDDIIPLLIAIIVDCPSDEPNEIHVSAFMLISALGRAVGGDRFKRDIPAIEAAMGPLLENLLSSSNHYEFIWSNHFEFIWRSVQGMSEVIENADSEFAKWTKTFEDRRDESPN